MSEATFGWIILGCGFVALILAAMIIRIEGEENERFYGNGHETGFKRRDKQG